ncbi:MAG TPA: T9SS type A sorting domain-containing protein [Ohtaekwangia sp.]|nr:T9SS type A sorting domain-containing protein [Ohtaekwangia sp.]
MSWALLCPVSTMAITLYTYTAGGSSGAWNVAGTWTTDPSGVTLIGSAIPGNNDVVHILNGFTVTLSANVATTGLSINIHNGGTLDLATFTFSTINNLSGSGLLKIGSGYFPTITSNNFTAGYAAGATVEFYDFTGTLPVNIDYPNLVFSNSTTTDHVIAFSNTSAFDFTIYRHLTTQVTGSGDLAVRLGTQATHSINLAINGNITVGENTTFGVGAFNAIHRLTTAGSITNNGIIDFSNSAQYTAANNGAAHLTFTGSTHNTLACNGQTDLYTLTVNKGLSSTYILSVTSTNSANLNFYSNAQFITITQGTLRLGVNVSIPRLYGNSTDNYNLGTEDTSPMLWIDGATVNTNGNAFVVYGKLRITDGSFTCVGREGTVIREEGQYIIEGGTFTTEKFRPSTTLSTHRGSFTMSGGTFNVNGVSGSNAGYARFSIPYPEQVFIMSGGVINVSNPEHRSGATGGGIHIGCKESNYIVTGGTINAILSGTAAAFKISSTAPFWNLNISRTGGTPTTVILDGMGGVGNTAAEPLAVLNDFTIDGINTPVFNANGLPVTIGRNFTINNGATYTPSANTTTFNGAGDQNFILNGGVTSGLYNLVVNKPSGALILGGTATTYTVTQSLTLTSGILNDGGKTLQVAGTIHNEAVHTGTGNITLNGSTTQTISGNGNGIFGNVILNNNSVPGVTATSDLAISGTLTLAGTGNSLFDISHYQLSLTSPSATALTTTGNAFSSTKMIRTLGFQSDRGVRKTFGNLSAFTFAFGVAGNYTPATIQLTSAPTTYGTITARPVNTRHHFVVAGNTNNLSYYWKVVSAGFTGLAATAVTHTYHYLDSDVVPAGDDSNYVPARYSPTTWTVINNTTQVNQVSNTISFNGVGYIDGDFTAGRPSSFGIVTIYYSMRSGNWSDANPGTTPWSNVSHSGPATTSTPGAGDQVFIGDGATFNHTITITSNGMASGGLEINSGSTLDVGTYTGHDFGRLENAQILGSGLLRISSATATAQFPAGDFGNFIRVTGGTVEYYTTGTQNFSIPASSATPTNLPLISYKNLILTPDASRNIRMPDQDIRIFNNMTVQGLALSGAVRLNSASSKTLTVSGNVTVSGGTLQFRNDAAQNVEVGGDLTISSGARMNIVNSGAVVVNELLLHGNLENNGTLNLTNGAYVCNTTFTGTSNAAITGTGSVTDFNILTVDKGVSAASVLNVNASAFTLSNSPLALVLVNGTFRLSSPQSVSIANESDFNIPATTRLSANGGTFEITGSNGVDLLLAGTLEILNGSVNVGTTTNDNSIEYAATGEPTITISGGSLNVRSQIRRSSATSQGALLYNQSGGAVSVGLSVAPTLTRGVLEILNPGSSFAMSGGTLRMIRGSASPSIADLYLQPTSFVVSGGTVEIGTGETIQDVDINTIVPLYNLTITGTSNTGKLEFNPLVLRGSLNIEAGNVFNANSLNVSIAGNFINANATNAIGVTVGGYRPGSVSQTTTFNGILGHQTIRGASGNLTNFGNVVFNNNFTAGTITLLANTSLRVNGTLFLSNGILAGGDNIITAVGAVSNSSTHTSTATGSITLAGTSSQPIGGNGNGKFGNLVLNNSAGATFSARQEITGVLTLSSGNLFIGSYELYLSNTSLSAISGATGTRYILTSGRLSDAGVTKAFTGSLTNQNFVFPIGVFGKYTPADYTITTGTAGGNITIAPVNNKHPSATGPGTAFINYYWHVTHTVGNLNALTHRYTYTAADEEGIVSDYRDARFQDGAWTIGITLGNPNTTMRVITFTNLNLNGDYTTGEATAFVNPTTYTSIASGNWEADGAVWDIDPPGNNIGPPAGSFVIINPGHIITMTASSKRMATLEVRGRLHLGATTGHDFGTVSTSGAGARTIQIQSSTFPTGNFSNFTTANSGTVEYDGAVILPTQSTYNNLAFSGAGIKTLPNADLIVNGDLLISAGTVTNAANNRNIQLTNANGNFTNHGSFVMGTGAIEVGGDLTNSGVSATFAAGNGLDGLRISGNFNNTSGATFSCGTDSLGVRGNFNNSATFNASSGEIHISGDLNNTSGTFTGSSGPMAVKGSLTNNAVFTAGTGAITLGGSYLNSGASAQHNANSNALMISEDFTNNSNASFNAGAGIVSTGGDWTNSASFNAGSGSVIFNSAASQALTGATTFYNLTRSNGGTLTLNNNINVNQLLTLSSGYINTGSNTINLTNTAIQPVSGYGLSAFVDGSLTISYPGTASASRIFPVGKGTSYRPVTIQQGLASTDPVVRVEMINTPPSGTYPSTIDGLSQARYYAVNLVSGTMNAPVVELSFNTDGVEDESIVVPGNVHIVRATASTGPWSDEGGSGVFSPAAPAGYATSGTTSINSTTYFSLGYLNTILPIKLKSFEAFLIQGVVELNWATFTEHNNHYFVIERSSDGIWFDSLLYVDGAGFSNATLYYQTTDEDPLTGISYYRLKQVDYDGRYTYSGLVVIRNFTNEGTSVSVYPNPAKPGDRFFMKFENFKDKTAHLRITDVAGRTVYVNNIMIEREVDLTELKSKLGAGLYYLEISTPTFRDTKKLIVF